MGKQVIVIASGETERRALPHLVAHLQAEAVEVLDVRIPPGNKALSVGMAERLVKAVWYERVAAPPDKFVILVDIDGKVPEDVLRPFREQLQAASRRISPHHSSLRSHSGTWRHGTSPTNRGSGATSGER